MFMKIMTGVNFTLAIGTLVLIIAVICSSLEQWLEVIEAIF